MYRDNKNQKTSILTVLFLLDILTTIHFSFFVFDEAREYIRTHSYSHPFHSSLSLLTSNPTSYTFNPSLSHSISLLGILPYLQATNIKHLEPLKEMSHRIYVGPKEAFRTYKPFPFHDNEEARAIALVSNYPINQYCNTELIDSSYLPGMLPR